MSVVTFDSSISSNLTDTPAVELSSFLSGAFGHLVTVGLFATISHTETAGPAIFGFVDSTYFQIEGKVVAQDGSALIADGNNNTVRIMGLGVMQASSGYAIDFGIDSNLSLDNTLINDGLIVGDVNFDWGDNVYNGQNGRMIGTIFMAGGAGSDDQVFGGAYTDRVHDSSRGSFGVSGDDTVVLGGGNDWYRYSSGNDHADGGAGIDCFSAEFARAAMTIDLSLGYGEANDGDLLEIIGFEHVTGSGFADTITGSNTANIIKGGFDNDTLNGLGGNDRIFGESENDTINGGAGIDVMWGGAGRDVMTGGAGNDRFAFDDGDTGFAVGARDVIIDFVIGQDKINLRAMDGDISTPDPFDDQDFVFIGSALFGANDPGKIRVTSTGTTTFIGINFDADASTDAFIQLNGVLALTASDFIL